MTRTVTSRCKANRGRKILQDTVMRLIGAGAGWCYKPDCPTGSLWHVFEDNTAVKLAEVAHIVAASNHGPRANTNATEEKLTDFSNLILLCPTCHTIVDRAPQKFTVDLMGQWKTLHEEKVRDTLKIRPFTTRKELNVAISGILLKNRLIWQQYGPDSPSGQSLITDVSDTWRRKVLTEVIPGNNRISKLLEANSHLLESEELEVIASFSLHVTALEDRHIGGIINQAAPRFPARMNDIFTSSGSAKLE